MTDGEDVGFKETRGQGRLEKQEEEGAVSNQTKLT